MRRLRLVVMAGSLTVVLLFSGLLMAYRQHQDELYRSLGVLAEVMHLVKSQYVDSLDSETLGLSLDAALVQTVDPWAAVLPGDKVDAYREMLEAPPPFGLGLAIRFSSAAVRHIVPGSPAATAGLETWEIIEQVEEVNTRGRPLWQIRLALKEKEQNGQKVKLTVVDRFADERREVVLEPVEWQPQPALVEQHEEIPVMRVTCLPSGAAGTISAALQETPVEVIDLRELIWGFEEEAVAVADLFAREGLLAEWRGQRAGAESFQATANPVELSGERLLVLIGPNTEGVGEILAAGLRRAGATLVGHRSIGHASHMWLVHDGDLHLWIPVGYWLRADEQPINENGVEPDQTVDLQEVEEGEDPVLHKALEMIRVRHGEKAAA
jgi:C-terminal processing protease CtpA/Prc